MHMQMTGGRRSRASISVLLGVLLLASIPAAAHAGELYRSTSGAYAKTIHTSSYGERTKVWVKDTASDSKRAQAEYHRTSTSNSKYYLSATGGKGSTNSNTRSLRVVSLKVCSTNNNPFDIGSCTGWTYP